MAEMKRIIGEIVGGLFANSKSGGFIGSTTPALFGETGAEVIMPLPPENGDTENYIMGADFGKAPSFTICFLPDGTYRTHDGSIEITVKDYEIQS